LIGIGEGLCNIEFSENEPLLDAFKAEEPLTPKGAC
jgi:hypothetical protein